MYGVPQNAAQQEWLSVKDKRRDNIEVGQPHSSSGPLDLGHTIVFAVVARRAKKGVGRKGEERDAIKAS